MPSACVAGYGYGACDRGTHKLGSAEALTYMIRERVEGRTHLAAGVGVEVAPPCRGGGGEGREGQRAEHGRKREDACRDLKVDPGMRFHHHFLWFSVEKREFAAFSCISVIYGRTVGQATPNATGVDEAEEKPKL